MLFLILAITSTDTLTSSVVPTSDTTTTVIVTTSAVTQVIFTPTSIDGAVHVTTQSVIPTTTLIISTSSTTSVSGSYVCSYYTTYFNFSEIIGGVSGFCITSKCI